MARGTCAHERSGSSHFESGFPHGHDQWISMAATAWSAMALMPATERQVAEVAR